MRAARLYDVQRRRRPANQLVVDVLVREVLTNMPPVSQTNNGQFLSVGVFSVNEVEYELFMKCVDYATLSDTGSAYTLAFTKEGSRFAQLPARLDSPYSFLAQVTNPSYITCTSANGGKPVGPVYTLYSGDTKDAVVAEDGSLAIEDADHKQRIAFYIGTTLSSRVDIESAQRECSTALCEQPEERAPGHAVHDAGGDHHLRRDGPAGLPLRLHHERRSGDLHRV